jgi:hypothetical protein
MLAEGGSKYFGHRKLFWCLIWISHLGGDIWSRIVTCGYESSSYCKSNSEEQAGNADPVLGARSRHFGANSTKAVRFSDYHTVRDDEIN